MIGSKKGEEELTDGVCEADIRESLSNFLDEFLADFMFFVVFLVGVTFFRGRVTTNRRDINQSLSKLDECPSIYQSWREFGGPFDGDVQICNVV